MKELREFKTPDNQKLKYIVYEPETKTKAILLVIHGISGATLDDYDPLAEKMNENGIKVYVLFLRGYPPSEGKKGDIKSFNNFFRDIESFYHKIRHENRDLPTFILGHSLGGAIVAHLAVRDIEYAKGVILVNPAFKTKGKYKFPLSKVLKVLLGLVFYPSKPVIDTHIDPSLIPHPDDRKEAEEKMNNPHIIHIYSPRFLWQARKITKAMPKIAEKADKPLLLIYGDEDPSVDPKGHKEIFSNWNHSDKDIYVVSGGGHGKYTLYRSTEEMIKWINRHI
ncbi:MAG: alpha/beta fold hydrolase [Candidatus Njordarchaeia archaeon]